MFGGAETFARQMAGRLASRGHAVEALTSCAVGYEDWGNRYPEGDALDDGVLVHRLAVRAARPWQLFGAFGGRLERNQTTVAPYLQREWMRLQGPLLPQLTGWIRDRSGEFDLAIFVTYLYYSTWAGLPASRAPAILHPTAHDEPPLRYPLFDRVFASADGFGFLTPEEAGLVHSRFGLERPQAITGIGIELDRPADPAGFRRRFGLGDRPYIACVGRIVPGKGSAELYAYFVRFKQRHPSPLALVLIGEEVAALPPHADVVKTGFVDEATRDSGVQDALLLVQPSRFESFSIVLCEAWAAGIPALVQGRSAVLLGQARRSGGALPYWSYEEFEGELELLLADDALRRRLGAAGRRYVEARYPWPAVLEDYEKLLERIAGERTRSAFP